MVFLLSEISITDCIIFLHIPFLLYLNNFVPLKISATVFEKRGQNILKKFDLSEKRLIFVIENNRSRHQRRHTYTAETNS